MSSLPITGIVHSRKHRVHLWVDTSDFSEKYGIQAKVRYGLWAHVVANGTILLFDRKADANATIKTWEHLAKAEDPSTRRDGPDMREGAAS